MRLWSIHPCYLDAKGLIALWREGLLAQRVLQGKTVGYKNHPQLERFKNTSDPVGAIAAYLRHVADEADQRGYRFDRRKIVNTSFDGKILVTSGQGAYEFDHLLSKLKKRNPALYEKMKTVEAVELHPMMQEVKGNVESWEMFDPNSKHLRTEETSDFQSAVNATSS